MRAPLAQLAGPAASPRHLLCLLLLCLAPGSHQLSLTEFVVPDAVEVGENVTLQCGYELSAHESDRALFVKWWWTPLNGTTDQRNQLYQRIAGRDPVAIHDNIELDADDDIILINVTAKDSGTYECEVSNIDEVRKHDELIVYTMGSGPELNISTIEDGPDEDDDDEVLVTCKATDVAPLPGLAISIDGKSLQTSETIGEPEDGLYDIFHVAIITQDEANSAEIHCELFYKNENITHPPYVDIETYVDPEALLTTDSPDDTTPEAADDSLQITTDSSMKFRPAWMVLPATLIPLYWTAVHNFFL